MTYKTDPFIPQQAETVREVVKQVGGQWTGREMVAGSDGVWHRLENPSERSALYMTRCNRRVMGNDARTRLDGEATCPTCQAVS